MAQKRNRYVSFDIEIDEELSKLTNASKLLNELAKDYFDRGGEMSIKELDHKINQKIVEIDKLSESIKYLEECRDTIKAKEKTLKEKFKDIPIDVIQDFKAFPKMDETILQQRFRDIYSDHYGLTWDRVLDAFKFFKDMKTCDRNTIIDAVRHIDSQE